MSLPSEGHAVLGFRNLLIIPKKEWGYREKRVVSP